MKKFLPFLFLALGFTGFLVGQIVFDLFAPRVNISTEERARNLRFTKMYRQLEFQVGEKKLVLDQVNAPIVILNFWASWCFPCLEEFPSLVALRKEFSSEDLFILGVNNDSVKDRQKMLKVVKDQGLNFDSVKDPKGHLLNEFMAPAIPFTVIYIKGEVYDVSYGSRDFMREDDLDHYRTVLNQT